MSAAPAVSQESYRKFLASTQALRAEYAATAIEHETLAAQASPDQERLDELAARLDGLQSKIHAEAVRNGIPEHVCGYAPAAV
jgi:predicted  nucleic acid-binding Zn-ribbon protein